MILVYLLYTYLAIGLITASWICFFKIEKIDVGAGHTSIGFRLLILPAMLLLWPLVIKKITAKTTAHHG